MSYRYLYQSRKLLAYSIMIGGVMLDQVTTRYGLYIGYYESNPIASWLIGAGLWLTIDILLLVSIIGLTMYISEKIEIFNNVSYIYPFLLGLIRMYAGIKNIGLIM